MYLSIIIPVYNTSKYVTDCIHSLIYQNDVQLGVDYEVICVNDGSTDNSSEVLSSLSEEIGTKNGGVLRCKSE